MHRIDGAGHIGNLFVAEDPAINRPPTEVTAEILNAFQEEIASVIEWRGIALDKLDNTQLRDVVRSLIGGYGQCALSLIGANLKLLPKNGNKLMIAGRLEDVPAASVSLAPAGLTPAALYYIYAFMAAGVMTLEASTTGHSTDESTGVEIKTGDPSRTLVGMARPVPGPAWTDTVNQRFVRSWFNDAGLNAQSNLIAQRSTLSSVPVETDAADRCEFLSWRDEQIFCTASAATFNSAVGNQCSIQSVVDGLIPLVAAGLVSQSTVNATTISALPVPVVVPEGYHFASMFIWQNGGTAANFLTNSGIAVWS